MDKIKDTKIGLILGLVLLAGCDKSVKLTTDANVNAIYVGAGQSNMERMNLSPVVTRIGGKASNIAVGNTSLAQWSKGGELYQRLLNEIQDRPITALFFYQGEWEGMNSGADTWAQRFTQFVRDVRADSKQPSLPVYFFRINSNNMYGPAWDVVREQQNQVYISGVKMISSDGCDLGIDGLHYSDPGYQCLAERLVSSIKGE